jgi:hypothetical protein
MTDVRRNRPDMRTDSCTRTREIDLAELAGRQHGVVSHRQLLAIGFTRGGVGRRIAAGRLHRLYPGAYAVGHRSVTTLGRFMAAVLACGPRAVASHRTAAFVLGIGVDLWSAVEVSTVDRGVAARPGIVTHRPRELERTVVDGIPVTTLPRTLLDLAEVVPARRLERAFEEADRLRLLDRRAVEALCRRSYGRHGLRPLQALLDRERDPPPATRSELEGRFLEACREAGLRPPEVNGFVEGFEVDAFWRAEGLAVELDGFESHGTRAAFERDRRRDERLQLAAGCRVLRFTHRRLDRDTSGVVEAVSNGLRQCRYGPSSR